MAKSLFDLREAWETKKGIEIKRKANTDVEEAAPKMKGDWLKKEREKNREHDAAMGRTATGRKKPTRTMTSTQRSLASIRKEEKEPASPDEGSMAVRQLEFMYDAIEDIMEHIEEGGDFPEWMQNKLTEAHTNIKDLYAAVEGSEDEDDDEDEEDDDDDVKESVQEATYKVDVEGLPSMFVDAGGPAEVKQNLRKLLKKADMIRGVERVQPGEVKKHFRLKAQGKDESEMEEGAKGYKPGWMLKADPELGKKVKANKDKHKAMSKAMGNPNAGKSVKEEVELDENMKSAAKELSGYASKYGGMDKSDFIKAAKHMETGNHKALQNLIKNLDTDPRDKILVTLHKHGNDIKRYGYKAEDVSESDAAYAKSMEKEKEKRLTQNDRDKLAKIRAMMAKERERKMKK